MKVSISNSFSLPLLGLVSLLVGCWVSIRAESPSPPLDLLPLEAARQRLSADLSFLASDEMRGRAPGTGGLERAADFIAQRWQSLGLETQLFHDSPFQEFNIPGVVEASPPEKNFFRCSQSPTESLDLLLDRDFRPLSLGANANFAGAAAFVGYGITATQGDWHYDDYAGLDVRGKVVIILRKEPRPTDPDSPFDGTKNSRHALFATKLANARQHGAIAVIFINDSRSAKDAVGPDGEERLLGIEDAGNALPNESLPVIFLKRQVIDRCLASDHPGRSLQDMEQAIDRELQPQSILLDRWRMSGQVRLEKTRVKVKNVIATLPGEGRLANETVVIGAHYDHVGMGGPGSLSPGVIEVHNGADDNASGTCVLLEVAQRFAAASHPSGLPRRRLVFIAFSAEERGLLGSRYYVAHPRFAIEATVAMINLDMVGRMTDRQLAVFGTGTAPSFDRLVDQVTHPHQLVVRKQLEGLGPSDHQPFYEQKIPVLHLFTGLHLDYHRPSDDFEKINTDGMALITDIVYHLGRELQVSPQRPQYLAVKGRANIRVLTESPVKLGIRMRLNNDQERIEVVSVAADSPAARAGLQPSDLLLRIDGEALEEMQVLSQRIASKTRGSSMRLEIQRGDQRIEVEVRF
jgi:hypothetical protein